MPKMKVKANELHDVDVTHISLVKRGANRVPFRIVKNADGKRSETMLNFNSLFRKEAAPTAPAIAAVIVSKSLSEETARGIVTKAGLSDEHMDGGQDGAFVFAQQEGDVPDGTLVKMDDNVALVVTGPLTKAFEGMNFESMSFSEIMAQEGFVPSVGLAMDMLQSAMGNTLAKVENREQLISSMESMVDEFGDFVTALARAVPEDAFRMEMMKYDEGEGDTAVAEDGYKDKGGKKKGDEAESVKKAFTKDDAPPFLVEAAKDDWVTAANSALEGMDGADMTSEEMMAAAIEAANNQLLKYKADETPSGDEGETVEKAGDDEAGDTAEAEDGKEAAQKAEDGRDEDAGPDVAAVVKTALEDALKPLSDSVGELRKVVDAQGTTIEEVRQVAEEARNIGKGAQKALKSNVNGATHDDPPAETRKGDDEGGFAEPPLIDTAYERFSN